MHPHILQPNLEVSSQNQAPAFKDLYGGLVSTVLIPQILLDGQLCCKATSDSNAVQVQVNLRLLGLLCSLLLDAGTGHDHHRPISPSWPASHLAQVAEPMLFAADHSVVQAWNKQVLRPVDCSAQTLHRNCDWLL